jgi:hypothetical protein
MAAVSQSIPNLLGGVSQQPDPIKLPGQVREAVNAFLDPTFGCKKRPATEFIAKLASNIPATAKWFPVFRDVVEKYIVCIYRNPTLVVRVWDAITGVEKTVTLKPGADAYLTFSDPDNLTYLPLADYTLIANSEREITMSEVDATAKPEEALVIINSVAYNTTYSIDLSKDGAGGAPVKVYSASKLEVTPGSYEVADGGVCTQNSAQDHSATSGAKTGLQFRIVNQCAAYLDAAANAYKSRYTTSVILKNGGVGWRVGDEVTVTQAGKTFTVRVSEESFVYTYASDGTATYTTPSDATSGTLTVTSIVTNLQTAVNAITGYSASYVGNVLRIKRTDTRRFNLSVRGGITNNAMVGIKNTANDFALLPEQCFPDFTVLVKNTDNTDSDDYYVKFKPDVEGVPGLGSWEETVAPNIPTNLNPSTMPHALVRLANGNFELQPLDSGSAFDGWAGREVGDEKTNPEPSFVGGSISGMFFYANRLGFLSEDAVIMSQPGDYFNFFGQSALTVSDADPIDLTAASTQPAILRHAIGTSKGLLLFAENAQFLISTTEVAFGPSTVKLTEIANYNYRSNALPINTGVSVMFATEAETYSKVFEMAVDSVDNRPQVAENTRIIPEYVPPGLVWSANSPNNSLVMFGDGTSNVWNFKFYNNGNERQIAGWGKWQFPGNVVMFGCNNDTNYLVQYDGTNHCLTSMELIDDPDSAPVQTAFSKFVPRLDNLVYKTDATIVSGATQDKVYFPAGAYITGKQPVLMASSGSEAGTFIRTAINTDGAGKYILVDKALTAVNFAIGLEYRLRLDLPAFYVTQQNRADRIDNPIVETLYLDLYYSGRYQLEVKRLGYDNFTFDIDVARADLYGANSVPVAETFTQQCPIYCQGKDVLVSVYADDPVPAALTSYGWQGHYNKRGIAAIR